MMDEPSANIIMAAPPSSLSVSFLTFLLVKKRQSAIFTYAKMKNVRNKERKKRNMLCVREKKKGHASNLKHDVLVVNLINNNNNYKITSIE